MICSTSSSSSPRAALVLALALALSACAGRQPVPRPGAMRVALFPVENVSGSAIPARGLLAEIERRLATAGLEVVAGDAIDRFLAKHRIRYTGGIDGEVARAAREDLGVEGVAITSVELYGPSAPPRFALTMRLVSTEDEPRILWIDGTGRTGDDHPGFLGLGLIGSIRRLEARELDRLARSLQAYLEGRGQAQPRCPPDWRFRPRIAFRAPEFDTSRPASIAILPFMNETNRRAAGEAVALELMRQLAAIPNLRLVEPGLVRDRLLKYRVIMEGGVSLDTARVMLTTLNADLVVAGYVREFEDASGSFGTPSVNFTVLMLDRKTERVVWEFTSHNQGDDKVIFFDLGKISTASALTCRMARDAVDDLVAGRGRQAPGPGGQRSAAPPSAAPPATPPAP